MAVLFIFLVKNEKFVLKFEQILLHTLFEMTEDAQQNRRRILLCVKYFFFLN